MPQRQLKHKYKELPHRIEDHANYKPYLNGINVDQINRYLHRKCWYLVKENSLEGFEFGKKELTIKFSLEQ